MRFLLRLPMREHGETDAHFFVGTGLKLET